MTTADEIIVLHYTRFGEKGVVLHTLSQNFGRRSFLVKDASRLMAWFQPLNVLQCEITDSGKSQLFCARAFRDSRPVMGIRASMGKNAISMFMAEVLYRATREGNEEPGLYEWCKQEIHLLDSMQSDYSNFHIRFLLDFASAMGFAPSFDTLMPFTGEASAVVQQFLQADFAQSMLIRISGDRRNDICGKLLKFIEFHLDVPLRVKSLGVLGELF